MNRSVKADKYKWIVLIGCALVLMCYFGIVNNIYSIYIIPVCDDLGFSRTAFSFIQTLNFAAVMIMSIIAPNIFKKFGILKTLRFSCLAIAILYFLCGCATDLKEFYVIGILTGLMMGLNCTLPTTYIIKQWFDCRVGLLIGIASSMSGLGGILFNQIAKSILIASDWRTLYKTLAVIMGVAGVFATFVLIKENDLNKTSFGDEKEVSKSNEIVDLKTAIPVMTAIALISFSQQSVMYTATPFTQDIGYSIKYAANLASLMMGFFAVGKMIYGYLIDRIGMRFCETLSGIVVFLGCIGYIFYERMGSVMMPFLLLSAGFGSPVSNVGVAMLPDFTSPAYKNKATGLFVAAVNIGGCLVPILSNAIYDKTGSYVPLFYYSGIFCVIQIIIMNIVFGSLKKNSQ